MINCRVQVNSLEYSVLSFLISFFQFNFTGIGIFSFNSEMSTTKLISTKGLPGKGFLGSDES